jgi:drug/metabolite transporter (DMT)-like permease
MATVTIQSSDVRAVSPVEEYRVHQKTYFGFKHLLKWAIGHFAFLLLGLYAFVVQGNVQAGVLFLMASAVVLVYGIITTPKSAEEAVEHPSTDIANSGTPEA